MSISLPSDLPETWTADVSVNELPIPSSLLSLIESPVLEPLVREALAYNPDLRATASRLKAEGYLLSGSRSQYLPKVEAGFSMGRNNLGINTETGERETKDRHRLSVGVGWEIDLYRSAHAMEVLLGRYPRGQLSSGNQWPTLSLPPVDTPASVLLHRPDIQAGLARVKSARRLSSAADKGIQNQGDKGAAVALYCNPLATPDLDSFGFPFRVKK